MRHIAPGSLRGRLCVPPSKSHLQRALLAASLCPGETILRGPGRSEDGQACLRLIRTLGAEVQEEAGAWRIRGGGALRGRDLDCGESAFCLRAGAALAALQSTPLVLHGRGTLATRPVDMLVGPFRSLGAQIACAGGMPPLVLRGPLRGGFARVDGRGTSQALSGLLLALPRAPRDSELVVTGLRSGPYVEMTLALLTAFGVRAEANLALDHFVIPGGQDFRAVDLQVEGDWSSAAFLLVAGALAGELELEGLDPRSPQADRAVLSALEAAGVRPAWIDGRLRVACADLRAFTFDATDCPDLIPPLAALAVHAPGTSRLLGAGRLRHKESDRAQALVVELGRLGARLTCEGDELHVEGESLTGGIAGAQGDHRIAMACAVAALRSERGVDLDGEACVAKSYPDFFADLEGLRT